MFCTRSEAKGMAINMRVISGLKRGTNLFSPVTDKTRPTTDRVRENIFNLIRFYLPDANVLDLFAGSGAMGIEALSQGGKKCVFVDSAKEAYEIINKNIEKTKFYDRAEIYKMPFDTYLDKTKEQFDVIFLDPPYHKGLIFEAMKLIIKRKLYTDNCIFVLESDSTEEIIIPEGFEILKEKIYGRVKVTLVREVKI